MIRPIVVYGNAVLRKKADPIDKTTQNSSSLINDMFDTLSHAEGSRISRTTSGTPYSFIYC